MSNPAGFWRRVRITPGVNVVQAELEDDFHCMSVVLSHNGTQIEQVSADMRRAPWTTCPGAKEVLLQTFTGVPLSGVGGVAKQKKHNCTHLFDLVSWAAKHAQDTEQTIYDVLVSDPKQQRRKAEIRVNGEAVLSWVESGFAIVEPQEIKGTRIDALRPWIESLNEALKEPAKILQWGNMLANGRTIPLEQQSDAKKMPPSCYTFQPDRAVLAKRVGEIRDFSQRTDQPLDEYTTEVQLKTQ
ncbi:MAG: DUF2889 domain-containing protein [Pseudomonadales bacterium]|nr:DUF2889 domain-containing protein [Pseudomonadales bacterium]